ncbi:MAG: FtsQ-type POTRA domain-containing protein [Acidobacteriota bacterium]
MNRTADATRRMPTTAGVAVPADKRFRRPDLRPDRRRIGRTVIRAVRWVLPALLMIAGTGWLGHLALHSSLLAVQHISVRGNARLSAGEVETLIDGIRGENIFQVDFEHYRRRVMDSPWVADVTLWRVLPATIEVRVTERVPMAVARLGQQLYLVDDAGVVIDEYGAQYRDLDLPIVDGLVSSAATEGPLVDTDRVRLTDALLASLESRPDLKARLSQIDVANAHDALVMFDNDPAWLHLGERDFTARLRTYLELAPTLKERFSDIDYVDLRFEERVFVHPRGRTAVDPQ